MISAKFLPLLSALLTLATWIWLKIAFVQTTNVWWTSRWIGLIMSFAAVAVGLVRVRSMSGAIASVFAIATFGILLLFSS